MKSQGFSLSGAENREVTKSEILFIVIPASEARRESFFEKDSGQAGMTDNTISIVRFLTTLRVMRVH